MHTPIAGRKSGQRIYSFENGLGASVISDGYGREGGLLELAVLDSEGHITYATPVTTDVLGWLTEDEVQKTLDAVAALTPEEIRLAVAEREAKSDWKFAVETDQTTDGFEAWKAAQP